MVIEVSARDCPKGADDFKSKRTELECVEVLVKELLNGAGGRERERERERK